MQEETTTKELTNTLESSSLMKATKKVDEKKPENHIGRKEFKAMEKINYAEISKDFTKSYVIQNTKTKQIVEIKALSSFHAAKIVGWRPRHVQLIQVNEDAEVKNG